MVAKTNRRRCSVQLVAALVALSLAQRHSKTYTYSGCRWSSCLNKPTLPRTRLAALEAAGAGIDPAGAVNIAVNLALVAAIGGLLAQLVGRQQLRAPEDCLPGRMSRIAQAPAEDATHLWLVGRRLYPSFPEGSEMVVFGMGCFWCSENLFMRLPRGVYSTAVGYSGGVTPNPTYDEVCSGSTNHAEVVRVVYNPNEITFGELAQRFWEGHDPTTANRQGNDMGTPYRSAIYCYNEEQLKVAERTREQYQQILKHRGFSEPISTEIAMAGEFYYAEAYHQQYDVRNAGYCGLRPTGATFMDLPAAELAMET